MLRFEIETALENLGAIMALLTCKLEPKSAKDIQGNSLKNIQEFRAVIIFFFPP